MSDMHGQFWCSSCNEIHLSHEHVELCRSLCTKLQISAIDLQLCRSLYKQYYPEVIPKCWCISPVSKRIYVIDKCIPSSEKPIIITKFVDGWKTEMKNTNEKDTFNIFFNFTHNYNDYDSNPWEVPIFNQDDFQNEYTDELYKKYKYFVYDNYLNIAQGYLFYRKKDFSVRYNRIRDSILS